MSALPARSPRLFRVTCTCCAPASTAARLLATASPKSLWQCTAMGTLHVLHDLAYQPLHGRGRRHADRVRQVDRVRTGVLYRLTDLDQVVDVGARRVHRREQALAAVGLDVLDRLDGHVDDLFPGLLDGVHPLDVRRGHEGMHHLHVGVEAGVDVRFDDPGQAAYGRVQPQPGDVPDRVFVACGRYGKTGFDIPHARADRGHGRSRSFFSGVKDTPGVCSPSRRVVSKISTFLFGICAMSVPDKKRSLISM